MRLVDVLMQLDAPPSCAGVERACGAGRTLVGAAKMLGLTVALLGVIIGAGMMGISRLSGHVGGQGRAAAVIMGGLSAGLVIGVAPWAIAEAFNLG